MKQRRHQPLDFDQLERRRISVWQIVLLCVACLVMIYITASELTAMLLMQTGGNP